MEKTATINEIVEAMAGHVCDQLCRYPKEINDIEELDRRCGGCKMGDYLCGILNTYNGPQINQQLPEYGSWIQKRFNQVN